MKAIFWLCAMFVATSLQAQDIAITNVNVITMTDSIVKRDRLQLAYRGAVRRDHE